MTSTLAQWYNALLDLFFPLVCAGCESTRPQEGPLCLSCMLQLPEIQYSHTFNPVEERIQHRFQYVSAFAWLYMSRSGMVNHLLHQIKYSYRKDLAEFLALRMAERMANILPSQIEAIAAVPIHPKKLKSRGYNQTHIIAEKLAEKLQIPFYPNLLMKVKNTTSQTTKSRIHRISNLVDSIALNLPPDFDHQHILIVDDVLTTGSTLEVCAQALSAIPNCSLHLCTLCLAKD